MADHPGEDFFAPPPFKPEEALQRARRDLRELGLVERNGQFERRGQGVARVGVQGALLQAAMVREPGSSARRPEWQEVAIANGAQLRDFVAELKRRLSRWSQSDE